MFTERFLRHKRGAKLSTAERARLEAGIKEVRTYKPRRLVARAGEPLNESTLLIDGFMCRYLDDRAGLRQLVAIHVPGDFLDLHAYPLADEAQKGHAGMGYDEQALVKVQMALLEKLNPMSQDFLDKLEHIEGAVRHHMYQEEGTWFLDLKDSASVADEAMLTQRYAEEYERYVGASSLA